MPRDYFRLVKWVIALFAFIGPPALYYNYSARLLALKNESIQRASFKNERREIIRQVLQKQASRPEFRKYLLLERQLPAGRFSGLPQPPDMEELLQRLSLQPPEISHVPRHNAEERRAHYLALLFSSDPFFSGMPKRFAGLIELLSLDQPSFDAPQKARLAQVLAELWYADALDDAWLGFLIGKLPEPIRQEFRPQLEYLGQIEPPLDGFLRLYIRTNHQAYLFRLPAEGVRLLNLDIRGLLLELEFAPASQWQHWGEVRIAAISRDLPLEEPFRQNFWVHLVLGLVLELFLFLIFLTLRKYEQVNLLQKQLLAAASHELRTPLAVMRQFAEMLSDRASQFPDKIQLYHRYILRENLKMQYLVEKLLSTARFENLDLTARPEPVQLSPWLAEVVERAQQLHDKPIRLETPNLEVFWDGRLLAQAMMNLLENARIHGQSEVEVRAQARNGRIRVEVRDFGTAPDLKRLRRPRAFRQGRDNHSGLGLGLYLSDKIVAIHRGKLSFEDAQPGLRVILDLPERLDEAR